MHIYNEPVYDLSELARYNLHVHTVFSRCAKPEMLLKDIVATAEAAGVEVIALTDHYNFHDYDECYLAQIRLLKRQAAELSPKLRILFSGELSNYGVGKQLESAETVAALDYRLYTCNHFHLPVGEHPEDRSPRGYAQFQLDCIRALMEARRADCIAHPLIGRFVKICEPAEVTKTITDNELGELSELGREAHVAWELNAGAVYGDPELFRRLWNIGREVGTYFHFGTDAHTLAALDTFAHVERLREILC